MNKMLVLIGSVALFMLVASISGGTRNVAFSAPGILTVALASTICFGGKTKNVFAPIKWLVALHAAAFAVLPVLLGPPDLSKYSNSNIHSAQWYLFVYLCLILVGYRLTQFLFPTRAKPRTNQLNAIANGQGGTWYAVGIFLVGFLGYAYTIFRSGGIGYFLSFKGPRPELFENVHGLFFRLSLFMMSGFALYAVVTIRKRPIALGLGALALGVMYFMFLGRGLAFSPIVIFTVLYHYQVKRIKAQYVIAGLIAGILMVAITGAIRSAGKNREALLQDPIGFLSEFSDSAGDSVERTLLNYFEHLDTFMLIKKYVDGGNHLYNGRTLLRWFEPFDRLLFGNNLIDSVSAGHTVAVLRDPRFKDYAKGEWPTLAGEFVLNYGLLGAGVCMLLYGACIQQIGRFLVVGSCSIITMAIHPYVFYILVRATLSGSLHLTNVVIYITPLLCVMPILKKQNCRIEWLLQYPQAWIMPVSSK